MASKPSVHMDLLARLWEMLLGPHWLQGLYMLHLHGAWGFLHVVEKDRIESAINKAKRYGYLPSNLKMYTFLLKVWNQNFSTVFSIIRTMFCISYYLLKRTFAIICDNDLIPLLFPQKTTIWSGRIFCIGCSLGIYTKCLYCVIPFHFTILCICWELYILRYIVFVLMLWFAFARPK